MTTSVLIVAYNSSGLLNRCVRSLHTRRSDIFVWDNSESPDEIARTRDICADLGVTLLSSGENVGFGVACNEGIAAIGLRRNAQWVVLVNPDARFVLGTEEELVRQARDQRHALHSAKILRPDSSVHFAHGSIDTIWGMARHHTTQSDTGAGVAFVTCAVVAVNVQVFNELGGFDRRFFLYWEDVELSLRMTQAGHTIGVSRDVCAEHLVSGSDSTEQESIRSSAYYLYNAQGRRLFRIAHPNFTGISWRLMTIPWFLRFLLRALIKEKAGLSQVLALTRGAFGPLTERELT